jgi:CheY-like chemotaxis protein
LRFAVRGVFEHVGMEVVEASNGREALALLDAGEFQLVVTDIQMPLMDGLELLRTIRLRSAPQPKVVVMSAHDLERRTAMQEGAYEYIEKPFEIAAIVGLARRAAKPT